MPRELTWRKAIDQVLGASPTPLHYNEITEHTIDRMSARWDRFSWFGLLPVSEAGELAKLPDAYPAAKLIPALEAILIEALEPRQNRKRGDDLAAAEYIQCVDPEIEKKKVKSILDTALNKL